MKAKPWHLMVMLIVFFILSFSITKYGGITGNVVGDLTYSEGRRAAQLNYLDALAFYINGQRYVAVATDAQTDSVKLVINPGTINLEFKDGETKSVDVNKNGYDDLNITLLKINFVNGKPLGGIFDFEILDEKAIQEQKELEEQKKLSPLIAPEQNTAEEIVSLPAEETNIPETAPEQQLYPYKNPENGRTIILVSTALAIIVLMLLLAMLVNKHKHSS